MIEVIGCTVYVPDEERSIGHVADHRAEVRQFWVDEATLADFSFALDLENGLYADSVELEKEAVDGGIRLTWEIEEQSLQYAGNLRAQLRAYDDNKTVWHSDIFLFFVSDSIYAPGTIPVITPSEYERIRKAICALLKKTEAIEAGDGQDSLLLAGAISALADYGVAIGPGCVAGRRGYYIKSIDAAAKKIYLAAEKEESPVFSDADNTDADFPTPGYEAGDWISIINGSHYYYCAKVQSIEHNVLTFEGDLGFAAFAKDTAQDGHTLYVPTKPEVGAVTFGVGGFAAGENCKGGGRGVFIGGRDNVGANYASIGGRGNQGGYGTGVFGTFNFIPGLGSFGGGNKHEIWGRYCGFTGNQNYIAPGVVESVIEGLSNRIETSHTHGGGRYSKSRNGSLNTFHGESLDIEGSFNDVEGRGCKVRGNFNFVRGDNLIACGNQVVLGAYNIEDPDKLLIIGGGTAKERKNILTIDREGNINGAKLDSMQEELDGMHAKLADMADFVVHEVMEGLTEEISIAPRFSFFGTYFRVLTDGVPIEETYLPIGEALRTAHGALLAENVQIALYDAGKQETMRCRLKLAHEDANVKYGHLERVV